MTSDDHDLHTLSGAYVLDAISDDERAAFTAHLADCAPCTDEIRELREATARLGTSEQLWPRPELRGDTIRAATMTSQLGPVISAHDKTAAEAAAPVATRAPVWRRLALVAAAVVVAAGAGFGVVMHDTMQTLHHSQRQNQLIAAVLNAPDAVMRTARVAPGHGSGGDVAPQAHGSVHGLPAATAAARRSLRAVADGTARRPARRDAQDPTGRHGRAYGDLRDGLRRHDRPDRGAGRRVTDAHVGAARPDRALTPADA